MGRQVVGGAPWRKGPHSLSHHPSLHCKYTQRSFITAWENPFLLEKGWGPTPGCWMAWVPVTGSVLDKEMPCSKRDTASSWSKCRSREISVPAAPPPAPAPLPPSSRSGFPPLKTLPVYCHKYSKLCLLLKRVTRDPPMIASQLHPSRHFSRELFHIKWQNQMGQQFAHKRELLLNLEALLLLSPSQIWPPPTSLACQSHSLFAEY